MICPLHLAANRFGDAAALLSADEPHAPLSFRQWDRAAQALRPMVSSHDRIAIQDPNTPAATALMFAALREGCAVVLLSHRLPQAEVREICSMLGVSARWRGPALPWPSGGTPSPDTTTVTDGIATILMTSGSSGRPKAVAHRIAAHLSNARGSHQNIPFQVGHVWLRSLDLHHIGGLAMIFRALWGGGAVAFPRRGEALAHSCTTRGVTHLSVVSTQLQRLLHAPHPPKGLAAVLVGGGPIPPRLIEQARRAGLPIHTTYGMTEMGSQVTTTPAHATPAQLRTAGQPLPGRMVRIGPGGEVLVRGEPLMLGYLLEDGHIDPGVDPDGWYHTGDVGALDDGWLRITGRKDQMFISGGENIYPEEIERVLMGMAGVQAAVVVPVSDPRWGDRPVAFVRGGPDEPALRALLREHLAGFQIPDRILPWPEDAPGWHGKPQRGWFTARARDTIG